MARWWQASTAEGHEQPNREDRLAADGYPVAMHAGRGVRPGARQLRLVVEVEDYDEAVRFYRDVLGLKEELSLDGPGEARVTILEAGRATLELMNPAQKAMIDDLEVGRRVAPKLRVASEVTDSDSVTAALVAAGADLIAPPPRHQGDRSTRGWVLPGGCSSPSSRSSSQAAIRTARYPSVHRPGQHVLRGGLRELSGSVEHEDRTVVHPAEPEPDRFSDERRSCDSSEASGCHPARAPWDTAPPWAGTAASPPRTPREVGRAPVRSSVQEADSSDACAHALPYCPVYERTSTQESSSGWVRRRPGTRPSDDQCAGRCSCRPTSMPARLVLAFGQVSCCGASQPCAQKVLYFTSAPMEPSARTVSRTWMPWLAFPSAAYGASAPSRS